MTVPPPLPPPARPASDEDHLRLLSLFHYIVAALTALFSCFPFIHVFIGIMSLAHPESMGKQPPPPFFGWIFILLGSAFILAGWTFAICVAFSGRFLAQRRRWVYCIVIAALNCGFFPFGTALGVFTILVLSRDSVKVLFGRSSPAVV